MSHSTLTSPLPVPGSSATVIFSSTAADLSVVDERGDRWLKSRTAWVEVGDVVSPARRQVGDPPHPLPAGFLGILLLLSSGVFCSPL